MDDEATPGKVTLIGTGHVFRIEDTIREAIVALRPDIVFIELDRGRLQGLMHRRKHGEMPAPRKASFVQRKLHGFQQAVAAQYGGQVGEEMLAAVDGAQLVGARIALIDRSAEVTIRKAMKEITWKEKFHMVGQLIGGSIRGLRKSQRPQLEAELQRYQSDSSGALAELADTYPTVYRVVIHERDELMSKRILAAMQQFGHGVAVVGDGHVEGMQQMLADLDLDVYRLEAVRNGALPKPDPNESDVSFSFTSGDPPQP